MSKVFFALSLTNGLAMTGMRSLAGMWPLWLLLRSSYGTDMMASIICENDEEKQINERDLG